MQSSSPSVKAIFLALQWAKQKGHTQLYLADQGDWITYVQYGKKLGFIITYLKTQRGLIDFSQITEGAILYNDMPAYVFLQNIPQKKKHVVYIGDVTGSIGNRRCNASAAR